MYFVGNGITKGALDLGIICYVKPPRRLKLVPILIALAVCSFSLHRCVVRIGKKVIRRSGLWTCRGQRNRGKKERGREETCLLLFPLPGSTHAHTYTGKHSIEAWPCNYG
nr:uncharacterized protein LOC112281906 isoform X1 [Physcomitrium patens]|eukprot:XP_024374700.1 uncharacterized protein LOC112281906 isoform X1 [Physcomitrella patens]